MTDPTPPADLEAQGLVPGTCEIHGARLAGHWIQWSALSREIATALTHCASTLSVRQRRILRALTLNTGLAASCYVAREGSRGRRVFSVRRQVRGPAVGFLQVEPETARSVFREALEAERAGIYVYNRIAADVRCYLGDGLADLEHRARTLDPVALEELLLDVRVQTLIFRLKLGALRFPGVPGFGDRGREREFTLWDQGIIWKRIWNTPRGAGTVQGFVDKVRAASDALGIPPLAGEI